MESLLLRFASMFAELYRKLIDLSRTSGQIWAHRLNKGEEECSGKDFFLRSTIIWCLMSSPGSIWRIIDEWANACSILNKQSCWIGESWRRKNAFWISKDGILLCREFKSRYEKCNSWRVLSLDIVTWEIESFHEKILFRHHNNNKVIEKKISSKVGCLPSFTSHTWSFLQLLAKKGKRYFE